ncbi:MAG: hypothetical protein HZB56_18960 [Deltaproteobacteria bacterium]|nr:hypothetical protein [Deltaproteobacteria bacterium]
MKSMFRRIAVGVAALGLSLPALATTDAATTATPAQKPAVTAKAHKQKKAHRKVAATEEKKVEKKAEAKAEQKPAPKAEQKPAPKAEQKPAPQAEQKPAPKAEQKPAEKPAAPAAK